MLPTCTVEPGDKRLAHYTALYEQEPILILSGLFNCKHVRSAWTWSEENSVQ